MASGESRPLGTKFLGEKAGKRALAKYTKGDCVGLEYTILGGPEQGGGEGRAAGKGDSRRPGCFLEGEEARKQGQWSGGEKTTRGKGGGNDTNSSCKRAT